MSAEASDVSAGHVDDPEVSQEVNETNQTEGEGDPTNHGKRALFLHL